MRLSNSFSMVAALLACVVGSTKSAPISSKNCETLIDCLIEKLEREDALTPAAGSTRTDDHTAEDMKRMFSRHGKRTQPSVGEVDGLASDEGKDPKQELADADLESILKKLKYLDEKNQNKGGSIKTTTAATTVAATNIQTDGDNSQTNKKLQVLQDKINRMLTEIDAMLENTEDPPTTQTPETEKRSEQLYLLSKELAAIDKRRQDTNTIKGTTPAAMTSTPSLQQVVYGMSDRVDVLSSILNKLIVVNRLAYTNLQQQIDSLSLRRR